MSLFCCTTLRSALTHNLKYLNMWFPPFGPSFFCSVVFGLLGVLTSLVGVLKDVPHLISIRLSLLTFIQALFPGYGVSILHTAIVSNATLATDLILVIVAKSVKYINSSGHMLSLCDIQP